MKGRKKLEAFEQTWGEGTWHIPGQLPQHSTSFYKQMNFEDCHGRAWCSKAQATLFSGNHLYVTIWEHGRKQYILCLSFCHKNLCVLINYQYLWREKTWISLYQMRKEHVRLGDTGVNYLRNITERQVIVKDKRCPSHIHSACSSPISFCLPFLDERSVGDSGLQALPRLRNRTAAEVR